MNRTRWNVWMALAVAVALIPGCGAGEDDLDPDDADREAVAERQAGPTTAEGATPMRAALPGLFDLMAGLERDMAALSAALWRADFDAIADHATAIANHPQVPPAERQTIAGVLGEDMAAFKTVDTRVHDLAVRIRTLAENEDLDAILTTEAELRQGCVTCHTEFRDRLREALR